MKGRIRTIVSRVSAVTALAIAATYAASFITRLFTGAPHTSVDLFECFVIPLMVGVPILTWLFDQMERLKEANRNLVLMNEKMQEACRQLELAHEIVTHTAGHDRMTGLLNRERFTGYLEQALRDGTRAVLLLIDADHFKQINDRYGHLKGDDALVQIARAIRSSVRRQDAVGRIGGEEFAVLLEDVSLTQAAEMAERIRQSVQDIAWHYAEPGVHRLSVSIGGAMLGNGLDTAAAVFDQADRCLYAAKRAGRNRVHFKVPIREAEPDMLLKAG